MGTTAQKLQKALDNKQLIIDKVNNKAGTSFDINSKLSDVANAIDNIQSGSGEDMLQTRVDANNSCQYLFYKYTGDNVDYISSLDTSNVTNMSYMFGYCSNLTSIPQLDTSNVTDMNGMFTSCSKLTSIPQLDTSNVTNMNYMFSNSTVLTTIDITYYNISSTSNIGGFVASCFALKSLIIREFGSNYVLNSNSLQNTGIANGTGYIYVPRSMVDTLKSATNWSTYALQIRALEDYTVDGTTTGALDKSKI